MATPFSDVYTLFLSNITDYSLGELDDYSLEENMKNWLINGIVNYPNPKSNLSSFDLERSEFTDDLDLTEKVILAKLMVIEYINPYIIDETLLKQKLSLKDYSNYSPANHLKELRQIKWSLHTEVSRIISRQSYSVKNFKEWFGKKNEGL